MKRSFYLNCVRQCSKCIKIVRLNLIFFAIIFMSANLAFANDKSLTKEKPDKNLRVDIPVKGKITDKATGETLIGVSVKVKGTTVGASTDVNGNFTVKAPDDGTLVISYLGYETVEIAVNKQNTINVTMTTSSAALSEVVVVGYGTQRKATVTGSVAQVKGEELQKSPSVNLSNSLAGRIPGVVARQASGEPGYDGSSIRIRGSNTLGNNNALIVIDGIPALSGGLDRLNPADIENVSVLKDASAAIYGARAANGVILITTKRGKTGKPQLSYDYNQGFAQPTTIPDVTNSLNFAELRNELDLYNLPSDQWTAASAAFKQSGSYTRPDGSVANATFKPNDFQLFRDGSDPWGHPNTDWFDATMKTWSPQARHNLQLTGGTDNLKYFTSLGFQNQDGYYKNSATGYKQYDMRINLDARVNKYINTQVGLIARQEDRNFPTVGAGQIFRMLMRSTPTQPAYWPNGLPGPDIENGTQPVVVTTSATGYDRDIRYYFQPNGKIELTNPWVEGLKFTGTASFDKEIRRNKRWQTPWTLYSWGGAYEEDGTTPKLTPGRRGPATPELNQGDSDNLGIVLSGIFDYQRKLGNHSVNLLAGVTRETLEGNNFNAFRRYFISSAIDQLFAGGDQEKDNGGGAFERARLNYFGRAAYNYKEKYLAEFLWRYDGSYIFPENSRFGFFPGVLAAWRISEEKFWKDNIKFIDNLKLRGSWGQLGNDQVGLPGEGEYQYLATYGFGSYIVGDQVQKALFESRVPNEFITWEVANNANIGMDGTMMGGKINFEFDVFNNLRTEILWQRFGSIPQTTGMVLPRENIGKVRNRGYEFLVGYNNQVGGLSFNVSVNGGYSKNRIEFFDENPGSPGWQRNTGRPMGTGIFYQYDGVFRDEADIAANTLDYSALVKDIRPGDMKYKDITGDGIINGDDRLRSDKNAQPTFQGGANFSMQYKNFDLSVLFQGATGGQLFIGTESGSIGNYLQYTYENRWTVDNPSSTDPRIADRGNTYYSGGNTYWLRSSDYLRLKNLEIGYVLPASVSSRLGMSNLRLYVNGLNLVTWDKMKLYDPESERGDGQYYPQARIINTGISVAF